MNGWRKVYIIGTDLNGRKCRVAQVSVPANLTTEEAMRYVQKKQPIVSQIEEEKRYA
jgi:hypothetical protein